MPSNADMWQKSVILQEDNLFGCISASCVSSRRRVLQAKAVKRQFGKPQRSAFTWQLNRSVPYAALGEFSTPCIWGLLLYAEASFGSVLLIMIILVRHVRVLHPEKGPRSHLACV